MTVLVLRDDYVGDTDGKQRLLRGTKLMHFGYWSFFILTVDYCLQVISYYYYYAYYESYLLPDLLQAGTARHYRVYKSEIIF